MPVLRMVARFAATEGARRAGGRRTETRGGSVRTCDDGITPQVASIAARPSATEKVACVLAQQPCACSAVRPRPWMSRMLVFSLESAATGA